MQERGTSGPVARALLLLLADPVPCTGGLVFSLSAAGCSRVLRKMGGLGEAKVLLVRPGSGMARIFLWRRASQKNVGKYILFPE